MERSGWSWVWVKQCEHMENTGMRMKMKIDEIMPEIKKNTWVESLDLSEAIRKKVYCWSQNDALWEEKGSKTHPGHARNFAWYRGQRPSPARVIKM